jgi:hypothetical protein
LMVGCKREETTWLCMDGDAMSPSPLDTIPYMKMRRQSGDSGGCAHRPATCG